MILFLGTALFGSCNLVLFKDESNTQIHFHLLADYLLLLSCYCDSSNQMNKRLNP